jgi:hypothetical protein
MFVESFDWSRAYMKCDRKAYIFSMDLHIEAGFDGSLPHGPIEVGLHKRTDVRRDWFGI